MKKASASFLLVIISALFISTQSFAQFQYQEPRNGGGQQFPSSSSEIISERVQQSLRFGQRIGLSELLRLSPQEQRQIEVLSLSISSQSFQGRGILEIASQGRLIGQIQVKPQISQQRIVFPALTRAEGLELSGQEDIFVESITAEIIRSRRGQGGGHGQREQQPLPQQMLSLRVDQDIRGMGEIALKQMVKQQLGLTLEGAEIERVVVEAQPILRGRMARVGVELNGRMVGPMKVINPSSMRTPLPINSFEEIRNLRLIVQGDVRISAINIRIGQVRAIQGGGQGQRMERIHVGQEISANRPLELSQIFPHEFRSVRSIALEARPSRSQSAEVALISWSGQLLASVIVSQIPMKPVLHLMTPMSIRDIRLQSLTNVIIDSLEIEFDRFPR